MQEYLLILTLLGGAGETDVEMTKVITEDDKLCQSIGEGWLETTRESSHRYRDSHFQCFLLTPKPEEEAQ